MEGTGKDLALSSASHGDADSAEKYGKLLYTLSAVPVKSQMLVETMVMKFYQDVIVFQKDSVFCWCCPKFYEQQVFPKYKLKVSGRCLCLYLRCYSNFTILTWSFLLYYTFLLCYE